VDGSGGKNFAWQGYSNSIGNWIIVSRRNTGSFQVFTDEARAFYRPSITGHSNAKRSLVWYDDQNKVYRAHYNGSGWSCSIKASDGSHPNLSAGTATAKYVWTSGTSSPYQITISSEQLTKSNLEDVVYHRAGVLQDTANTSLLWVEWGEITLQTAKEEITLSPIVVPDLDLKLTPTSVFTYLDSEPFLIPEDATSIVWYQNIYGRGLQQLTQQGTANLTITVQFITAASDEPIGILHKSSLETAATESWEKGWLSADVSAYQGQSVVLRVTVADIAAELTEVVAGVVEIYQLAKEGTGKQQPPPSATTVEITPSAFALLPNYPNPFNPETKISYQLPEACQVTLTIYKLVGQEIGTLVAKRQPAGVHTARWDGKDAQGKELASGIYVYRLEARPINGGQAGAFVASNKLALVR